ncbi:MAG TPA: hypothetical protein VFG87_19225 [Amycolatopsis sp.]|jgi:hypothetical protein|nr:hypothetical protein [Amycolatopsis sp.]
MSGPTRTWLAAFTGLIAVLGYAGAVALLSGALDLGDVVNARLPFESPAFAGAALAVIVAVPMTVVSSFGFKGDRRTGAAAVIAGSLLLGWIAVEIGFTRTSTWIQPVFAFAGLAVLMVGLRDFPARVGR